MDHRLPLNVSCSESSDDGGGGGRGDGGSHAVPGSEDESHLPPMGNISPVSDSDLVFPDSPVFAPRPGRGNGHGADPPATTSTPGPSRGDGDPVQFSASDFADISLDSLGSDSV